MSEFEGYAVDKSSPHGLKPLFIVAIVLVAFTLICVYVDQNPEIKYELQHQPGPDYTITSEKLLWGFIGLLSSIILFMILKSDWLRIASDIP